ncbi:hypothetical protein [Agarilytica rhodophyticola]|uniref:hypothetical protein n=1 Tax=Agarilytica rhodophyticola TaxID=1737490 RepID=UPI000B3467C9|nr:hypothetical protein [Agarilytica rhodophyticola]
MISHNVTTFDMVTMEFPTSYENAFLYISNPKNIPKWTLYLVEADETSTVIETPEGKKTYGFITQASFGNGTIDWYVITADGRQVERSCSRLTRLPNGNCVYSFMFFADPNTVADPAKKIADKKQQMEKELENLKIIFNNQNSTLQDKMDL